MATVRTRAGNLKDTSVTPHHHSSTAHCALTQCSARGLQLWGASGGVDRFLVQPKSRLRVCRRPHMHASATLLRTPPLLTATRKWSEMPRIAKCLTYGTTTGRSWRCTSQCVVQLIASPRCQYQKTQPAFSRRGSRDMRLEHHPSLQRSELLPSPLAVPQYV